MKVAVVSCMKNEGPFVLEWVAYHKAIGFDDIYVVTNDCTDGTDLILERLQAIGVVHHHDQTVPPGHSPQLNGLKTILGLPQMSDTSWLLHIDADEFLRVSVGEGRVGDLLEVCGHADNIALMWRPFGNSGHRYWRGGSVLRSFLRCQGRPRPPNSGHKSMFRPAKFSFATDHMPKMPHDLDILSVNSKGDEISSESIKNPKRARYGVPGDKLTWDVACIHHYAIRSLDIFLMKNDRGDGMGHQHKKYYLNSTFFRRHNSNDVHDTGILERIDDVEALLSEWLQDTELRRLEQNALRVFQDRRDRYLTSQRIADLTM
ncbi:glycosyltransferase family 2 protein [Rhodobacteraceae bacterium B1Z28]|uniref:Glycosyltransferase family 2 protein n=1 Tax=Ruegeria haliotis TaxID=2747601 RepID=A0ABX2PPX8_9RHOB|nr:glycosyltransferase family 2 protein [Ruegeria haliotis]NVO56168.1 glycosyltransferase family 2 protein [Ruegeria haliotis]